MSQIWFTTLVIEKSLGHSLAHEPNLVHSPGDRKKIWFAVWLVSQIWFATQVIEKKLVRSLAREPNLVCNPGDRKKIWFTAQVIEKNWFAEWLVSHPRAKATKILDSRPF